jgi:hypothetical protein
MGAFEGSARLLGEIIGFGITAVLFIVCVLPSYFILKLMSGSKTSFTEDVKEYLAWRWRPQPRPETSRMLSTLDSVESTVLEIYKYVLILGLVLASVFIGWLFINAHNDAARSFPQRYFGAAYVLLVVWVVGNLVMIKRRQARRSLAGMTQTASPEPVLRASVAPGPPAGIKTAPSQSTHPDAVWANPTGDRHYHHGLRICGWHLQRRSLMLRGFPPLPF